ncbi:MAG: MBL fold metallo-hydrolase [Actinomycetes bacterium]
MKSAQNHIAMPVEVGEGVWRIRNRVVASNTYICRLEDRTECIVIDPGLDAESVHAGLRSLSQIPKAIFCTHGHFDHIGSAASLQKDHGATLYLHAADVRAAKSANFTMMIARVSGRITVPTVDALLAEGDRYSSGRDEVTVVHTPGHTPGSCCIRLKQYAFTGDTLYRDGVGLTNFPGEDSSQLLVSVAKLWNLLPDSTVVCPGHGGAAQFADLKRNNLPLRRLLSLPEMTGGG